MPNSASNNLKAGVTLGALMVFARQRLKNASIDNPDLDIRLLVCHALKLDRVAIINQMERPITAPELNRLSILIECRARHTSVARLMGEREFWSLPFGLNEATLEPRPDSETLVESTLKLLGSRRNEALRLLDLGTGTGCLLLSLLHELPNATGLGIDLAPRAVEQATRNAERLNLAGRITFRIGNWLENIEEDFDVIISNPPYIRHDDIATLMPEVREHDPLLALDGGDDGLAPYRHLIPELRGRLNPGGIVVFEVGKGQAPDVQNMLESTGLVVSVYKDLGGIERCVIGWDDNYIP